MRRRTTEWLGQLNSTHQLLRPIVVHYKLVIYHHTPGGDTTEIQPNLEFLPICRSQSGKFKLKW